MIIVVSCGAKKRQGKHRACDLYIGPYFLAAYAWASSVASPSSIYILSAKYGLVNAHDEIDSYDLTLGEIGSVTSAQVKAQALQRDIATESLVYVVGGTRYVAITKRVWPSARAPFGKDGGLLRKNGIGYQMQALKQWRGRVP